MQLFPLPSCQRTTWRDSRGIRCNHSNNLLWRLPRIGLTRSGRISLRMRRLAVRHGYHPRGSEYLTSGLPIIGYIPRDPLLFCGDEGDRTLNLRLAKPALSQLSYVPGSPLPLLTQEARSAYAGGSQMRSLNGCTWIRTKDLSLIRAAL